MRPMLLAWWLAIVSPHMSARRLRSKARDAVLVLCAAFALLVLPACTPSTQQSAVYDATRVSNINASVIESLQTSAMVLYRFEQELALSKAVQLDEGKAQAQARVWVVRNQWRPVWDAFERARLAHETLATLIATAGTTIEQLNGAQAKLDELLMQARALMAEARNRVEGK